MGIIQEDIKNKSFKRVYLIWGEEDYLRNLYKTRLCDAVVPPGDNMNRTCFIGKDAEESRIIELSETLPFMSERRLILIEDSGLFKKGADDKLIEYFSHIPEETVIVFSETEVDKKRKPYKAVKKLNGEVECKKPGDRELKEWIAGEFARGGKKIRGSTAEYLIERTGNDMYVLKNETDKLISFVGEREEVTADDIKEISSVSLSSSVFAMIDDIAGGRQKKALDKYYELILLKEAPMRILYLLSREFNMLLMAKELSKERRSTGEMAGIMKVPEFAVRKYLSAASGFTAKQLKTAIEDCLKTEDDVKKGRIADRLGTELMIVRYSGERQPRGGSYA